MRNNVYSDIMLIQGYAITCIWKKNENFQNFMYNIYDKLWGDDITNSLIWIFIRTGQEMFSEKMWNFKMSQLPYFLSDFHHFCTNLWGNFYSFFWNYVNSGLDFPFKTIFFRCDDGRHGCSVHLTARARAMHGAAPCPQPLTVDSPRLFW